MVDEKKITKEEIKNEELTDEQANKASGGYSYPSNRTARDTCYLCGKNQGVDEMTYVAIRGEIRHVCRRCAGVR